MNKERRKKRIIIISVVILALIAIGSLSEPENTNRDYSSPDKSVSSTNITSNSDSSSLSVCEHQWADATCTLPQECTLCGATSGEALGHDYQGGDCVTNAACTRCNAVEKATGHQWSDATCTAPKTCTVCGKTKGKALGHNFEGLSCTSDGICSHCGEIKKATDHSWTNATCSEPQKCKNCGATSGEALGHTTDSGECTRCGKFFQSEEPDSSELRTIYITKTGKKYHYDPHCNGGTYYESTLAEAKRRGLQPCKKCIGD